VTDQTDPRAMVDDLRHTGELSMPYRCVIADALTAALDESAHLRELYGHAVEQRTVAQLRAAAALDQIEHLTIERDAAMEAAREVHGTPKPGLMRRRREEIARERDVWNAAIEAAARELKTLHQDNNLVITPGVQHDINTILALKKGDPS